MQIFEWHRQKYFTRRWSRCLPVVELKLILDKMASAVRKYSFLVGSFTINPLFKSILYEEGKIWILF